MYTHFVVTRNTLVFLSSLDSRFSGAGSAFIATGDARLQLFQSVGEVDARFATFALKAFALRVFQDDLDQLDVEFAADEVTAAASVVRLCARSPTFIGSGGAFEH